MRSNKSGQKNKKCIVLGIDGLDPQILSRLMRENQLPNFTKLAGEGTFSLLKTSNPAVSPVAWTNIATGAGPEYHGIFDFLHRQPKNYMPFIALRNISDGIFGTRYKKVRRCKAFWDYTSEAGIPTTVIRWPVTFPAEKVNGRFFSGLGVPDLLGFEGKYTYFTTENISKDDKRPESVVKIDSQEKGNFHTYLRGPMFGKKEFSTIPLYIKKKTANSIRIELKGSRPVEIFRGKWTGWIKVAFQHGLVNVHGMVKFLLIECELGLKLFASPINIDPGDQIFPITYPAKYGGSLEDKIGTFTTLGMPELAHPLSDGRYGYEEFLSQVRDVSNERKAMFINELEQFDKGILAFVFDHIDRLQHVLWSTYDTCHPNHKAKDSKLYGKAINESYKDMDNIIGTILKRLESRTPLLVMSDHGFGGFNRQVHINRWLIENGYMHLRKSDNRKLSGLFKQVDWEKTKAYAMGFASIYINLAGREECGIVKTGDQYTRLCNEIAVKLKKLIDSDKGSDVINQVYITNRLYGDGPLAQEGPDLLVGMKPGYRFSWKSALGAAPVTLLEDNNSKWSGDHIFDPDTMPGVLFSNKIINIKNPDGIDIAPTLLNFFNLSKPKFMSGKNLFS